MKKRVVTRAKIVVLMLFLCTAALLPVQGHAECTGTNCTALQEISSQSCQNYYACTYYYVNPGFETNGCTIGTGDTHYYNPPSTSGWVECKIFCPVPAGYEQPCGSVSFGTSCNTIDDPCCNNPDPCCGSTDPCCGVIGPCCPVH